MPNLASKLLKEHGFTLIEVVVAMGIASGALVLLLSSNRASLARSLRSNQAERLEVLCETKLDEYCCGIETSAAGILDGMPGFVWTISKEDTGIEKLEGLERLRLVVSESGGLPRKTSCIFRYVGVKKSK